MKPECTEERFLNDVKNHTLTIVRDEGNYRHLHFKRDGSSSYYFNIVTWNGCLCIESDCGTFVFSRIEDMFEFFRKEDKKTEGLYINTGYWGEKLKSISTYGGYKEFSPEVFEKRIEEVFSEWEFENTEQKNEVEDDVKERVLAYKSDGDYPAMRAAMDYKSDYGHKFQDFWEYDCKEYTFQYLWCLYAIAWGIGQYDKAKKNSA